MRRCPRARAEVIAASRRPLQSPLAASAFQRSITTTSQCFTGALGAAGLLPSLVPNSFLGGAPVAMVTSRRHTHEVALTERRISDWCRRLWQLSADQHAAREREAAGGEANRRGCPSPGTASLPGHRGFPTVEEQRRMMDELRLLLISDHGRLPVALVDAIWQVVDSIVLPEQQQVISPRAFESLTRGKPLTPYGGASGGESAARITQDQEDRFFEFLGLLTELDIDVAGVEAAAKRLLVSLEMYKAVAQTVARAQETESHADAAGARDPYSSAMKKLASAKNQLMAECFNVRTAGSPVFFTWLRHSTTLGSGLRRLMDLRRTVHAFDVLCAKRLEELGSLASARRGEGGDVDAFAVKQQWLRRQQDVKAIDSALAMLFHEFFSREWLVMEELTWYSTPPSIMEKIMQAETVHPFREGLRDMKARLQPTQNRHLFAFFHPAVAEEPLIAVQVALTKGIARSVDALLGRPSPIVDAAAAGARRSDEALREVDTAIFYSINSAQSALRGMDMGNQLIKRVVREVEENINTSRRACGAQEIRTFSTLSPIPGYTRWLSVEAAKLATVHRGPDAAAAAASAEARVFGEGLTDADAETRFYGPLRAALLGYATRSQNTAAVSAITYGLPYGRGHSNPDAPAAAPTVTAAACNASALQYLLDLFKRPEAHARPTGVTCSSVAELPLMWWHDSSFTSDLQGPLLRSVAHYLLMEKQRGRVLDPVGNFHISNGATMLQLNYLGNCSVQGSQESGTVMVNYWYNIPEVGANATRYEVGRQVSVGEGIRVLLQ